MKPVDDADDDATFYHKWSVAEKAAVYACVTHHLSITSVAIDIESLVCTRGDERVIIIR